MHKKLILLVGAIAILTFPLQATAVYDTLALDSLNRLISEAARAGNDSLESKHRLDRICFFYNYDLNDSLYCQAPLDMEFDKEHELWDNYYETWEHLANDYTFSGKVNTGLRELRIMHADALYRGSKYGLGLAYYGMGNAYISMEHYDEAEEAYEQSLKLLVECEQLRERTMILDLFSYYCDVLNEKRKYNEMLATLDQWKAKLEAYCKDEDQNSCNIWYAYYFLAMAQAHLGLGMLSEAGADLDKVKARTNIDGQFLYMSELYYRAQLYLQQGRLADALRLNSERLQMSVDINDVSSPIMIRRQRAEILKGLGKYREAADMYLQMYLMKDSFDSRSMRDQANELKTLFKVEELAREQEMTEARIADAKRLERTRFVSIAAIVAGFFLLLFMLYWYTMSRRLSRKNEELVVAHEQAQESSRMKTKFIQNISHEIRTPLNILSGFAQIMAQEDIELSAGIKHEASEKIMENTNRITTLINQLLALSESDSLTVIERKDTVSCNTLCRMAIERSGLESDPNHHFSFNSQLSDEEMITTHNEYVVQSLSRLLHNGQKFTPKDGSVSLACRREGEWLVIAVEDTGCGIPASESERVFEPFVQLNDFQEGVGIGLSVSRNLVRRLGGDIVVDTSYTGGARLVLTLPLSNPGHP